MDDGQWAIMTHEDGQRQATIAHPEHFVLRLAQHEILLKDFLISSFLYCYSYVSVHQLSQHERKH